MSLSSVSSARAVFYLRLSKEDRTVGESDSIANQRLILQNFLKAHSELQFCGEYIDDGKTGTHFNRPGFSKMMEDLESKQFDCILCKDCSRFGRDYIDCGFYIRAFDETGIRFIAVNDQYDSFDPRRDDTIFAIKNVINTEYSRGKSRELKKLFKEKQYSGQYMGAFSVYGYQKDAKEKHHFVIDPYAACIVRRIFSLFCEGVQKQSIARLLTEEGIPSPEEYKHAMGSHFSTGQAVPKKGWSYGTIHAMLGNPVYIGSTVQNKTYRKSMRGRAYKNPPENWIIVEHTHEPIISPELWETTQRLLKERRGKTPDLSTLSSFAGFLKCADCGASLSSGRWGKQPVFLCGTYKRFGRSRCSPHLVPKQLLYDLVLKDLNDFLSSYTDLPAKAAEIARMSSPQNMQLERELAQLMRQSSKIGSYKKRALELYSNQALSLSDLQSLFDQYHQEEALLHEMEKELHRTCSAPPLSPWVESFTRTGKLTALDRSIVADTISSISVSESKEISICYRF